MDEVEGAGVEEEAAGGDDLLSVVSVLVWIGVLDLFYTLGCGRRCTVGLFFSRVACSVAR